MFTRPSSWLRAGSLLALMVLAGCRAMGPPMIPKDRFDYSRAIADSWKQQTLLNIVKMRYLDLPIFLDVASVVSGYQWETSGSLGGTVSSEGAVQGNYLNLGASGRFTDRPTITYLPKTGDKFLDGMLRPLPPVTIFQMLQAGYAADFILEMNLDSLCGLRNRPVILNSKRQADPEFFEVLRLFREIQDASGFGIRVDPAKDGRSGLVVYFRHEEFDPEIRAKAVRLRELLRIPAGLNELRLVASPVRGLDGELTVATRSMLQIMSGLALGVEVPPMHRERKLTPPFPEGVETAEPLLRVRSGPEKPADAFAAVKYEDAWFWIANDDWRSKRSFGTIMFLFTMAGGTDQDRAPVITIPAQ